MSNVRVLPVWKEGATAAERFDELANLARERPEQFSRFVLVYEEDMADKTKTRVLRHEVDATYAVGLLTVAQLDIYDRASS